MSLSMASCWGLHISTVQKQSTIRAISHLTCLQEASDFVHVYVLVGHAIMAVLTVFIVRKAHLSVKLFMEGFIKFDSRS